MPSGNAVTNISVATSESWNDKETGEKQEKTEWHRVVFFGRLAEIASDYLKKGSQVYVEGRLQTSNWEDQQGQKHYKTEVVVTTMQFLDSRVSDSESAQAGESSAYTDSTSSSSEYSTNTESNAPDSKQEDDYIKDDIPF